MSTRFLAKLVQGVPAYLLLSAMWLALAGIAYFEFGVRPKSVIGWACLIILGPLAWVTLQAAADGIRELFGRLTGLNRIRDSVSEKTQGKKFSGLRIGWLLIETLLFLSVIIGVAGLLGLFQD